MQLAEGTQQLWQTRAGNARKAADAQRARAWVILLGGLLQERVARADHILNIRQQLLARVRQADALTVALEQRTADFSLQFVDQVRHGELRVAKLGRRLAEAAAFHRRKQCPQFSVVHMLPPFYHSFFIIPRICSTQPIKFSDPCHLLFSYPHEQLSFLIYQKE